MKALRAYLLWDPFGDVNSTSDTVCTHRRGVRRYQHPTFAAQPGQGARVDVSKKKLACLCHRTARFATLFSFCDLCRLFTLAYATKSVYHLGQSNTLEKEEKEKKKKGMKKTKSTYIPPVGVDGPPANGPASNPGFGAAVSRPYPGGRSNVSSSRLSII